MSTTPTNTLTKADLISWLTHRCTLTEECPQPQPGCPLTLGKRRCFEVTEEDWAAHLETLYSTILKDTFPPTLGGPSAQPNSLYAYPYIAEFYTTPKDTTPEASSLKKEAALTIGFPTEPTHEDLLRELFTSCIAFPDPITRIRLIYIPSPDSPTN